MATLCSLPQELTIHILKMLLADSDLVALDYSEPVPLLLSRISRFFRELMLNTPILWTHLRLHSQRDLHIAPKFIEHSKSCLIDVSVGLEALGSISPEILQSYAVPRWARLTVCSSLWSETATVLQAIAEIPTPELRDVRLFSPENDCSSHAPLLLSGAATTLTSLTMRGCPGCLAPLPRLTKLNIFRLLCDYEEFRDLIQASPSLETLILGELTDRIDDTEQPSATLRTMIEAHSLKYLAVGFTNTDLISVSDPPVLEYLSAPNIEYLELRGSRVDLGDFSRKEYPALRTLCLRDMIFPPCDAALYRSFSKITHLELNDVLGVEALIAPDEGGALPFPNLQSVTCTWPDEENCAWLQPLLERRSRIVLRVLAHRKGDVLAFARDHDVEVLSSEPQGLIRSEDFAIWDWEDEDEESDFSGSNFGQYPDEFDFLQEMYDEDYADMLEYGEEEEEFEDEDEEFEDEDDDADWGF